MKTLKIKIIKESKINETLPAVEKGEIPDASKATLLVVAGDSIAVGLSYHALGLVGTMKKNKRYIDSIPGFDAILGGRPAGWVDKNLNLDSYSTHPGKKILIVIAGTNDALNWSIGGNIKASAAAASVDSMVSKAMNAGFDATVMKLHAYTGKRTDVDPERHRGFIEEFNSAVGSHKTFDMVTPTSDGVHAPSNTKANTELLNRALKSLSTKIEDISLPSAVSYRTGKKRPQIQTQPVDSGIKKDEHGCYELATCNCITAEISRTTDLKTMKKALNLLNPKLKLAVNTDCNDETRAAIKSFQRDYNLPKSENQKIKCDSCIGPVTYGKIINKLGSAQKQDLKLKPIEPTKGGITISTKQIVLKPPGAAPGTDTTRAYGTEKIEVNGITQRRPKIYPSYTLDTLYKITKRWAPSEASDNEIQIMAAVGFAESGGIPRVLFDSQKIHRDLSYGIWQINMIGKMGPYRRTRYGLKANEELFNPGTNCQIAWDLWRARGRRNTGLRRFRDWRVTYKHRSSGRGWGRFLDALNQLNPSLAATYGYVKRTK